MKILVLSDTHISTTIDKLPREIIKETKDVDMCLHAGDFTGYKLFKDLSHISNLYGVYGNMDTARIKEELPAHRIINVEDIRIALTHGAGMSRGTIDLINQTFKDDFADIDIFIFGHSHLTMNKIVNGKIYFNPGSPTDKIFSPYNSYGILEVNGRKIKRRMIKIG